MVRFPLSVADDPSGSLVSVIVPVFQGAAYLAEAVASILSGDHQALEVILVDDGSTDDSAAVMARLAAADARIRPISIAHQGQIGAVMAGVAVASGAVIARMDQDDLARPDRLTRQLAFMAKTGAAACGGWARCFGAGSRVLHFPSSAAAITQEALFRSPLLDPTLMIATETLRALPYDPADRLLPDMGLFLRLAEQVRITNLPEIVLDYRCHQRQLSTRGGLAVNRFRALLSRRVLARRGDIDADLAAQIIGVEPVPSLDALDRLGHYFSTVLLGPDQEAALWLLLRWVTRCCGAALPFDAKSAICRRYAETLASMTADEQSLMDAALDCVPGEADHRVAQLSGAIFTRILGWRWDGEADA